MHILNRENTSVCLLNVMYARSEHSNFLRIVVFENIPVSCAFSSLSQDTKFFFLFIHPAYSVFFSFLQNYETRCTSTHSRCAKWTYTTITMKLQRTYDYENVKSTHQKIFGPKYLSVRIQNCIGTLRVKSNYICEASACLLSHQIYNNLSPRPRK